MADAAALLTVIAGPDPLDPITLTQPSNVPTYTDALDPNALKGARIGVPRFFQSNDEDITKAFDEAVEVIRTLGATVVDPAEFPNALEIMTSDDETTVLNVDFKVWIFAFAAQLACSVAWHFPLIYWILIWTRRWGLTSTYRN